eukprot:TRINITY_DN3721_c0_g1_i5.p4 TRINITY_DN3721_c0_g1~~TRINITY_DN3721_c0_g1_i5.p4  ORF type:complete len:124 (-),score=30.90 TRINITY_DN3721_c0_g1_i5:481-852(-)
MGWERRKELILTILMIVDQIVRVLTITVATQLFSVFCIFVHYAVFGSDGIGLPGMLALGEISDMMCQLSIILLLFVFSTGYGISSLQLADRKRMLAITMAVLCCVYLILFVSQYAVLNPASNL